MSALTEPASTYNLCRFCLMCRHVCPVGRTTKREATTPHGWALLMASVDRGQMTWDAEAVDTLYQCADCGLCQSFCVTNQPLPAAIVATRARVAAAGLAPATVIDIDLKLKQWGNPYREVKPSGLEALAGLADAADARQSALFVGAAAQYLRPQTLAAARFLLGKLSVAHTLIGVGRSSAYLPYTLGLTDTARTLAQATLAEISATKCKRVVVLSPEDVHTFQNISARLGLTWPEGVIVVELVELVADALNNGGLKLHQVDAALTYHDPAHALRQPARAVTVRKLLAALAEEPLREMFWREQRAAPGGSVGGLEFTQPALAAQMTRERLAEARATGAQMLVTEDPATLAQFLAQSDGLIKVQGLYELLAEQISDE